MTRQKLVVVGNGMAGIRTLEEMLKLAPAMYDITVIGAEPHPNYNRILLSPVLSGDKGLEDIVLNGREWYEDHGIRLLTGDPVVAIDRGSRYVVTASGHREPYDRLLLATGSKPFMVPVPGVELPGVMGFRDIADVAAMLAAARSGGRAVVIGGGLLGLEAEADLVVMAVGIRPSIELAREAGLYCDRGIVVHDTLQTFDPRIYAVGECVQHRGTCYGLVAPLFEQARVCASHLARLGHQRYEGSVTSTKLKVTGIDLFSAGEFNEEEGDETLVLQDPAQGVYKKLVLRDNQVKGAVLFGDTLDGSWYFQLLREGTDVSGFRGTLLFGRHDLGDAGHGDETRVAALPDDAEICGCNGVCKGAITTAIAAKGLFTVDDVRAHTKASSSCGSCTGLVEALLAATVGQGYDPAPSRKPLCKCTEHSHDDVIRTIREHGLKTMPAVFDFMEWQTPDGCHVCRPALNYYLLAAWPGEYVDDAQSRFINERAHGNIQKDGSYSVVPRFFGGLVRPDELRAIADVAEKFKAREVKVTGGQRIDLFGIAKEDLPAVWADLGQAGLVFGHAYGKALRTCKTCVGSEWCRFGTQDSTALGVRLEEMTWGSWMPHKFKMAVSGCPRNCAEATIKDFAVVCVESGYELHIGGNGGIKVRTTDILCKVDSEEKVLEYCAAFIQLYREEAHYLERTAPWVERVGLAYVKQRVLEDTAGRSALVERFTLSQRHAQVDPWAERVRGAAAGEFTPCASPTDGRSAMGRAAINPEFKTMNDWIVIARLEDIPRLGSRTVVTDTLAIALFRTRDDRVFALRDSCPHRGGPLSQGIVHGTTVTCPLHNWQIDLASGQVLGPDEGCVHAYGVKVEEGLVHLSLTAGRTAA